jgi:hypothetical protein
MIAIALRRLNMPPLPPPIPGDRVPRKVPDWVKISLFLVGLVAAAIVLWIVLLIVSLSNSRWG